MQLFNYIFLFVSNINAYNLMELNLSSSYNFKRFPVGNNFAINLRKWHKVVELIMESSFNQSKMCPS